MCFIWRYMYFSNFYIFFFVNDEYESPTDCQPTPSVIQENSSKFLAELLVYLQILTSWAEPTCCWTAPHTAVLSVMLLIGSFFLLNEETLEGSKWYASNSLLFEVKGICACRHHALIWFQIIHWSPIYRPQYSQHYQKSLFLLPT